MKKIYLILVLFSLTFIGRAQGVYENYSTYTLEQSENKLSDILRCESGMTISFGYAQNKFVEPSASDPIYSLNGFSYDGDAIISIWGPIGLDLNFIGLNCGFGKFLDESAFQMSWNFGLMPMFGLTFDDLKLHLFAGPKMYISFLMDGTDSFPLTTLNDGVENIGKGIFFTGNIGADIIYKSVGLRINYGKGLSGRLKDSYYENSGTSREVFDPRYNMLNVSFIYYMDL